MKPHEQVQVLSDLIHEAGYGVGSPRNNTVAIEDTTWLSVETNGSVFVTGTQAEEIARLLSRAGILKQRAVVEDFVTLPKMFSWEQIGGSMQPGDGGATIARTRGSEIELIDIQPVREWVGDREAREVGFPFWTKRAEYDLEDLNPGFRDVRGALDYAGLNLEKLFADYTSSQRAIMIAHALLDSGVNAREGRTGWSNDILFEPVKWWSGTIAGPEYLAIADAEFRIEVLGEEDEDEDENEDGED